MVTPDEIASVAVFAALEPADLERLCRIAADISLGPGEYAAHDGDPPALFALLEGRIAPQWSDALAVAIALALFAGGLWMFRRLSPYFEDFV